MKLIAKKHGYEIWAKFDHDANLYELFFDQECETFTGWSVDNLKEALNASKHILDESINRA
jgi:hypothetical protein